MHDDYLLSDTRNFDSNDSSNIILVNELLNKYSSSINYHMEQRVNSGTTTRIDLVFRGSFSYQ